MYNLIIKDLRLQKSIMLLYVGIGMLYFSIGASLALTAAVIGSTFAINSHWYDSRKGGEVFLVSLPYSRAKIILSKYLGNLLFTVVSGLVAAGLSALFNLWKNEPLLTDTDPSGLLYGIMAAMLFASIYFPFFYKFTNRYLLTIFSFLVILLIFFGMQAMKHAGDALTGLAMKVLAFSKFELLLYSTAAVLILTVLSYFITVHIYKNKEY